MFNYNDIEYTIKDPTGKERKGFVEIDFLEILQTIVPEQSNILDIGANIGNHTIFFEKVMKAKKVYSFEPITDVFKIMLNNFKNNDLMNVVPYNIAISSKEKTLQCISKMPKFHGSYWLWYDDEEYTHPYDMGYLGHNHCNGDTVTDTIISKPLDLLGIKEKIHLIKIDVEGMELEVIKGASTIIKRDRPVLQIEVCKNNKHIIHNMLIQLGYKKKHTKVFKNENQLWVSS